MMSGQKRCLDDQDPDYPDVPSGDSKRQRLAIEQARTNSCDKIRRIIRNQFGSELRQREEQLVECQDRLHQARQALQLLRYLVVTSYYHRSQTSNEQTRLHPAVKKLVGTQGNLEQVLNLDIPSTSLAHPVIASTSSAAGTSKDASLYRPEGEHQQQQTITKHPRYIPPKEKESNVIISPPRAANHKVKTRNPPFHLSRRGWGEFPVRVQIHFHHPQNRPLDVIHQLRLDHTYTGLQTLGAETVVDVWLFDKHSNSESSKPNTPTNLAVIKQDPSTEQDVLQINDSSTKVPAGRSLLKSMDVTESKEQESLLKTKSVTTVNTDNENITYAHSSATEVPTIKPLNSQNKQIQNSVEPVGTTQNSVTSSVTNTEQQQSISPSVSQSKPVTVLTAAKKALTFTTPKLKIKQEPCESSTTNVESGSRIQHLDYAMPIVIKIEDSGSNLKTNKCITIPVNQPRLVSKLTTIKPTIVGALGQDPNTSKQIIRLKSFTMPSNANNKNPLQVFRTSILKSNPQNGLKNATVINGVDKNGVFQQIPSILPQPVPPLIMISKQVTEKGKQSILGCPRNVLEVKPKLVELTESEKLRLLTLKYKQQLSELGVKKVDDEEVATLYLLRNLPLIKQADAVYKQLHPYVAPSAEVFLAWPLGKRKAAEAMRAREVSKLLVAQGFPASKIWTIGKLACRYGFTPFATNSLAIKQEPQESATVSASHCTYSEPNETLTWLETSTEKHDEEENTVIDIETLNDNAPSVKTEIAPPKFSSRIPVEESASCVWVKNLAAQIGIGLLPEDIGQDTSICASQIVILEASKRLMEDLFRRSLSASRSKHKGSVDIEVADVQAALQSRPEFDLFTNKGLGVEPENVFR
ncbi:hypothetical protein B566_EDAN015683 [Ephemera danica]|nr:hypothetical protein B566_EDAN015683 [Ephemera danica]